MDHSLQFGGGATQSNMHPAVLLLTVIACAGILFLPRKYAFAPVMGIAFLTPWGEEAFVAGLHLYAIRIVICAGCVRLARAKAAGERLLPSGLNTIDRIFILWAFFRGVTFILLYREGAAVINQVSFWLDTYGCYFLFRYLIQDKGDLIRAFKLMAGITAVLAVCMLYEYFTRTNLFSYISTSPIVPWIRDGKFRAQGPFTENSITAGSFGAVLLPLFFWLWKSGDEKAAGIVGMLGSTIMVVTSVASTAAMAYLGAILGICLWPLRARMRTIRWGLLIAVVGLDLVMKAPVWFLIARVSLVGGHGWDRANMINLTITHFFDWWLLGSKDNASWGFATWDSCNQFVYEALSGGLISLVLFITLIKRGFSVVGRARKRAVGKSEMEWLYWCLGAALFAHVLAFTGVDYMDATQDWWFAFLAIICAATALPKASRVHDAIVATAPSVMEPLLEEEPELITTAAAMFPVGRKRLRPWGGPEL